MHTTSTRPARRRGQLERVEKAPRTGFNPNRSIYTGDVLQEIARQQAAGNKKFSGRAFALKARGWSLRKLFGRA